MPWHRVQPKAVSQQPAAAQALVALLDKLHSGLARGRRGSLALVRAMSSKDPCAPRQCAPAIHQ